MVNRNQLGVFKDAIRNALGPVAEYLDDPSVTEILINGPEEIFVEKKGVLHRTSAKFPDEHALQAAVANIAQSVGRRVSEEEPQLDARLPDNSRIHAVLPPCSRKGTTLSIRKFTQSNMTFKDYVRIGSVTADAANFLSLSMFLGKNILVSGGTGSGKTTLLGMLCGHIPPGQRIIVIEDASELTVHYEHVVFFETKMADVEGRGGVSIRDLVRSSLRLRPDRIIVGEVRGEEALELIQAMNTGHKGCLGTIHANAAQDALVRLEALASSGETKMSEKALRYQIEAAIDLVVQVSRYQDGSRRIASISEVLGFDASGNYNVVPIYQMSSLLRGADGRLHGQIEATGEVPSFMQEIIDNRIGFPVTKFQKKTAS